ncbi:MAG: hypothetical protein AAF713_01150 [Pseudomonadota bacterium]
MTISKNWILTTLGQSLLVLSAYFGGVMVLTLALMPFFPEGRDAVVWSTTIVPVVLIAIILLRRYARRYTLRNARVYSGSVAMRLDPQGLRTANDVMSFSLDWRTVDVVAKTRKGILIMASNMCFGIPASALPAGMDRDGLYSTLREWWETARTRDASAG